MSTRLTLSETLTYSSRTFAITCDESQLFVYRVKDNTLIEVIDPDPAFEPDGYDLPLTKADMLEIAFERAKTKYILDYDNVLTINTKKL